MALSLTSRGYKRNMGALRVRIRVKSVSGQQKNLETIMVSRFSGGARYRTRTGTLSPAVDFESTTSTNSITPATEQKHYTGQRR